MEFNEYQKLSRKTAVYPGKGRSLVYTAMGLAGESGELLDKVKKLWRNLGTQDKNKIGQIMRQDILTELGDTMWYQAQIATELGYDLNDVALLNLAKLKDRKKRNVIKSEGDHR